jgi:hypothetical protein
MESKLVTGKDLRVEIRHTTSGKSKKHKWNDHAQFLLIVYPDGQMRFSANGTVVFSRELLEKIDDEIEEAQAALFKELKGLNGI